MASFSVYYGERAKKGEKRLAQGGHLSIRPPQNCNLCLDAISLRILTSKFLIKEDLKNTLAKFTQRVILMLEVNRKARSLDTQIWAFYIIFCVSQQKRKMKNCAI